MKSLDRNKDIISNPPEVEFDHYADSYETLHAHNIKFSGEEPSFFSEYKVRVMARQLAGDTAVRSIVDFGAGVGASVPFFRKYFPDARVTCLDVSSESLKRASSRHGATAAYTMYDGTNIPMDTHTVDLVFAACVFHHISPEEHLRTLIEIRRVLKPHGHFFVFEHNPLNPLTVYAVNTCPFDENAILIRAGTMRRRIAEAGFNHLKRRFCLFFPAALSAFRPMERYLGWLPVGAQYFVWGRP